MSRAPDFGPPADDTETGDLLDIQTLAFLGNPDPQTRAERAARSEQADLRVLRRKGRVAGGLRLLRAGQWIGGARINMAGVAAVGVAVEHRGSGVGAELMRAVLPELHTAGYPISVLYPATQPVYRQAGFEQAGHLIGYKLATVEIDARDRDLEVRPGTQADFEAVVACYTERARRTSGNLDRTPRQWSSVWPDDDTSVHRYVVTDGTGVAGYVSFTHREEADGGVVRCRELCAVTRPAARRLLRVLADHRSQVATVTWRGAPVDPMAFALAEQAAQIRSQMLWMLRVVDVRTALEARGYPSGLEAELHLDVRDEVCGWNHGRFCLEVSRGRARVRKGGRGRLKVHVRGLAPLYTGLLSAAELQATGLVEGPDHDLQAAARVFGGPAPWMPDYF